MNFLAHLYLSGNNHDIMTGNIFGDFLKGRNISDFNDNIRNGIKLHKLIDNFTDHHYIVNQTKQRLRPVFNHYASVIADIYYDHFLAANWSRYSDIPLKEFSKNAYHILQKNKDLFPLRFRHVLVYMRFRNLLVSYAEIKGIRFAFNRIANITANPSNINIADKELIKNYDLYKEEFTKFFPLIKDYVEQNNNIFICSDANKIESSG